MTPEQIVIRREGRIDALIDKVEGGGAMTAEDWQRLDALNELDMMSAELGGARELLEAESEADGIVTASGGGGGGDAAESEPDGKADRTRYIRAYDEKRQKRADRLFHWSLDMPPEDDDVNVSVWKGIGWRELLAVGLIGLGIAWMMTRDTTPASDKDTNTQYAPSGLGVSEPIQ